MKKGKQEKKNARKKENAVYTQLSIAKQGAQANHISKSYEMALKKLLCNGLMLALCSQRRCSV